MVKIRLRRVGAKKKPTYRVVVADSRSPRNGRFIENIGHYNPRTDPPTVVIKEDRALYWLSVGAQPSEAVNRFFNKLDLHSKVEKVHGGSKIADLVDTPAPAKKESAPKKAKKKAAEVKEAVEEKVEDVKEAAAEKVEEAKEAAADAKEAVAEKAEDAKEAVAEKVEEVKEAASDAKDAAAEKVEDAKEAVAEKVEDVKEAAAEVKEAAAEKVEAVKEAVADMVDGDDAGDIASLGLSGRVASALEAADVKDIAALRTLAEGGKSALTDLSGIGPKAAEEILEKLGMS